MPLYLLTHVIKDKRMDKFKDMTVEAALQTQATFKTDELVSILGRSSRSFHR